MNSCPAEPDFATCAYEAHDEGMTIPSLTPDTLLTTTRTVRKRLDLDRPVPLDLVAECLEIALQAPSGSNRQSWQWIVITDDEQRRAIGDIYRRAVARYLDSSRSAGKLFADDPQRSAVQQRVADSVAWLGEHMGDVPVQIIPCLNTGGELPPGTRPASGDRSSRPRGATCLPRGHAASGPRGRRCT